MSYVESSATAYHVSDTDEIELRKQIEEYYLPKQLVDAILENGGIPRTSQVAQMGIGFIDIADYTYLSKFLSPQENQAVLNGLYTAFNSVLKRHGGYLNKIEGDSLMFHYGGLIDPRVDDEMDDSERRRYIAKELFYTCIEMQRVCVHFNNANEQFLYESENPGSRSVLERAFEIISALRSNLDVAAAFNALFQIRIRIGANIGEVTIGNFGPDGAKQWDVIGIPVINAKRMETTAPIGGLRISEELYRELEHTGVVEEYYQRFKREAQAVFGQYRLITREELFQFSIVRLQDKKGAEFRTYSVQVDYRLPESIMEQVELLLAKGDIGAERILGFLQYYRGNRFVTGAIETIFRRKGIRVRKADIFKLIHPKKFTALTQAIGSDQAAIDEYFESEYSLYQLFEHLGRYQDAIKNDPISYEDELHFRGYEEYMQQYESRIRQTYDQRKDSMVQRAYFFNVVYPLVFTSIRASIAEYQTAVDVLELIAE